MQTINKDMVIGEILKINSGLAPMLLEIGMHCLGCPSSQMETLEDACMVHNVNADEVIDKMNAYLQANQ